MTNIFQTPNLLRISGDFTLCGHFGGLLAVTPIRMPGSDPFDYVVANFRGLHLEIHRPRRATTLSRTLHRRTQNPAHPRLQRHRSTPGGPTMNMPFDPKLVRLWDATWTEAASGFVVWHTGFFWVDLDHPIAEPVRARMSHDWTFTVYSTDELVWKLSKWSIEDGRIKIWCTPFLTVTRDALRSDDYLIELWLAAERKFWDESVDELQRLRAENAQLREDADMWTATANAFGRITPKPLGEDQ